MNLALKEWAAVIRALEEGTQILLLRKGGISESSGDFRMENDEFLLYPTYEHQNPDLVKTTYAGLVSATAQERTGQLVRISSFARVDRIFLLSDRAAAEAIHAFHIWNKAYVDMRLDYKPDKPLFVVLLRVFRLRNAVEFVEKTEYVGCRSWVELDETADTAGAVPVLDENRFNEKAQSIAGIIRSCQSS